ncbi:permease-like cell division protein FtsX [Methylomagnum ishizawai]|uniref:permease-like cell division protein FtsX n=1 Tax=Methylomagnum ishizawai TaxID=1760988 RepID=UPI001C328125|nr:permease-like cell division protein FtsX [Methylomagnum ishizawai]BBL73715.1 cell division protein FtsX [Methylomagnum ishizawai]
MDWDRFKFWARRRNGTVGRAGRLGRGPVERLQAFCALQRDIAKDSFHRLRDAPLASALTILVIAIALTLPADFHALIRNAQEASAGLEATSRISLFLKPELSNDVARRLAERLRLHPKLAEAQVISKEEGLRELRAYSGFGDALEALDYNPLPAVISLKPKDGRATPDELQVLLAELSGLPEADFAQFDTEWLRKLRAMLAMADRAIVVFGLLLGLGVLFIVGNTIRLELQHRREEIAVAKLLGATDGFIIRPFLYAGFWYGLLGGSLAWVLSDLLLLILRGPALELAELYGSAYRLAFLNWAESELLIGASVVLGVAGAWAVVFYHLRKLDPD